MTLVDSVRTVSYFANMPDDEIHRLAEASRLITLDAGEVLFHEGETAEGLYVLRQGSIKVVRYSNEGRELIVRQFAPGETFNEVGALDESENAATAIADKKSTQVVLIPGDVIRSLIARDPQVGHAMTREMAGKLRYAMGKLNNLVLMEVKERLAAHLLRSIDDEGVLKGISHEELAAYLGTVRQVLGRALGELQRLGAVEVRRGSIRVIDKGVLEDLLG